VHNLNRKDTNRQSHSGRPKSSRTPHNLAAVRDSVDHIHSPSKSVRRQSQELGINRESARRILIADLHMYPCRIQIKQKLTPDDMRKRVIMWQWFCHKIDAVPDFLDNVWFSDEAHFLLSGHFNSKNNIFWGSTPSEHCLQGPLHFVKCTAWVAISKHGIIGPFWFEDDNRELCPPDPKVPAAPGSSFGAHFLSATEAKIFCSTDLKLWRCQLHRLGLM